MAKERPKLRTFNSLQRELRETEPILYNRLQVCGKIYALRYRHELSQRKLASISGVAQKTISRMESGKDDTSFDTMAALADALGYELFLREKEPLE